ncbi:right-handed parallel beta-helix repeat-containing protein [Polyangium jinanense]|uniref:Right-handed parallel beta-helix repeat-containing protein n=1 Tax=Polyangium jinanense TaxID=2829994 RepID=A0A9X4AZD4_9BACT|nr:right-handed parallel beta-helix repeat-containing protein [Polyangium jinanense]MDC3957407.1 right-handed parallel beta-helix repeat-containing protein [Polyangium jinanense]MDC3988205.1 right-handed parallel beta-helix repeat-containing protein [Polyangium jinanense]
MRDAWMRAGLLLCGVVGMTAGCFQVPADASAPDRNESSGTGGTGGSGGGGGDGTFSSGGAGGSMSGGGDDDCAIGQYPTVGEIPAGATVRYVSSICTAKPGEGDGTRDKPFASLQEAVKGSAPGDYLVLMNKSIFPENVVIDKPLTILGTDPETPAEEASIIVQAPAPNAIIVQSKDVTLRGLIVQNPQGAGIWVQGGAATIDASKVTKAEKSGGTELERGNGILATDDASIIVQRTIIVQSDNTGVLMQGSRGTITGSTISENKGVAGIWVQRSSGFVTLSGNMIAANAGTGVSVLSSRAIIVQNTIGETAVGGNGDDRADGIVVAEHFVNGVSEGFAEASLQGNEISGNARLGVLFSGDARGIIVQNTVKGNGAADTAKRGAGIWVQSGAGALAPITIEQNVASGNGFANIGVGGNSRAIIVQNPSIGSAIAKPWTANGVTANAGEGIVVFGGGHASIKNNVLAANGRSAVLLEGSASGTTVQGNTISGSEYAIIVQNTPEMPFLEMNTLLDNGKIDIVAAGQAGHPVPHETFDTP